MHCWALNTPACTPLPACSGQCKACVPGFALKGNKCILCTDPDMTIKKGRCKCPGECLQGERARARVQGWRRWLGQGARKAPTRRAYAPYSSRL